MIFSNLSGTTSDEFKIGSGGTGKVISRNAYDIFWGDYGTVIAGNPNVKSIPSGTDLNTILDIGQYYMPTNTDAPSLINSPTVYAFIMTVEPSTGLIQNYPYLVQKITDFRGNMYARGYSGAGDIWYEWTRTMPNSHINSLALKSELPTIEEGAIVPDTVDGYTARVANVRYTAYKYSNKTVFDAYGTLALTANNPADTYSIVNLPFTVDAFPYIGFCQFMSISALAPMSSTLQYLSGDCTAMNNAITFKLSGYNTTQKTVMSYGLNSFLRGTNLMFNLTFRVRIG